MDVKSNGFQLVWLFLNTMTMTTEKITPMLQYFTARAWSRLVKLLVIPFRFQQLQRDVNIIKYSNTAPIT